MVARSPAALLAKTAISLCVLAIAFVSPFAQDAESFIARLLPKPVSNFIRDHPSSWTVFNLWTWILTAPAIALTQPGLLLKLLRGANEERGVLYSDHMHPMAALDVYHHGEGEHGGERGRHRPVVVFVHGGAWSHGSKDIFALVGKRVREAGYVSVVVGYRRYPAGDAAAQVEDVGAALAWVAAHATHYGGDPTRVALVGHSSGAHISALHVLASATKKEPALAGAPPPPPPLRAFLGLSGVYDIWEHYQFEKGRAVHEISALKPANGGLNQSEAALPPIFQKNSPRHLASQLDRSAHRLPRILLYHSSDDTTVASKSTLDFYEALAPAYGDAPGALTLDMHHVSMIRGGDSGDSGPIGNSGGHGGVLLDLMMGQSNARFLSLLRDAQLTAD